MTVYIQRTIVIARKISVMVNHKWWFSDIYRQIEIQKLAASWHCFWLIATFSHFPEFNRKQLLLLFFFFNLTMFSLHSSLLCEPKSVSTRLGGTTGLDWGSPDMLVRSAEDLVRHRGSSSAHMPLPWYCTLPETVPLVLRPAIGTYHSPTPLLQPRTSWMVHAV